MVKLRGDTYIFKWNNIQMNRSNSKITKLKLISSSLVCFDFFQFKCEKYSKYITFIVENKANRN